MQRAFAFLKYHPFFGIVLPWVLTWLCLSPWASGQSQRERNQSQPEPTWVSPAGYSLNQQTQQSAAATPPNVRANGQREFNALPPPNSSPRAITSTAHAPSRIGSNTFPEVSGTKSDVTQASYSDLPASMNFAAPTTSSPGPLELRPSSKDKTGSVERPKSSWGTAISMLLSLAVVLSFFLLVAWLVKKSQPHSFLKLPGDVVQVMGRTPMAPRQQMYVVRFGSKLLLISHQPGQTQTLGEITDADEVQRLAGLCEANQPGSISNSFRDVLKQVTMGTAEPEPRQKSRLSRGRA